MSLTSPLAPGPVGKPSFGAGRRGDRLEDLRGRADQADFAALRVTTAGATRPFNVFASWVSVLPRCPPCW